MLNREKRCKKIDPLTDKSVAESCPLSCKEECQSTSPPNDDECTDDHGFLFNNRKEKSCKNWVIKKPHKYCNKVDRTTKKKVFEFCPSICNDECKPTTGAEPSLGPTTLPPTYSPSFPPTTKTSKSQGPSNTLPSTVIPGCKKKGTHNNGVTDKKCAKCAEGDPKYWWPCNSSSPVCEGDACENSPRWTGPRIKAPISGICTKKGTHNNVVDNYHCAKCADGYDRWPCNMNPPGCMGAACANSPTWASF